MIKSMTGYGKANLSKEQREYQIEIKSVNHRYLDISVKMPRQLSYLEETIKKEIMSKVKRGKIDVFVTFENNSLEGKEIKINEELAKAYVKELKKLAEEENLLADIQVNDIAKYPDVLKMVEDGKLSAGHARCLVVVEDKNNQIKLANAVVQRNLSVRDLEKAVKNLENPQRRQIVSQEQSLELKELIIQMQKTFATKVTAIGNDNKGRIYIDYYTRDDLDRIAELLDLLNKKEMTLQDLQNFNRRQGK